MLRYTVGYGGRCPSDTGIGQSLARMYHGYGQFPFPVHLRRRKTGLNYRIPTSLLKWWMRLFFHIRHRFYPALHKRRRSHIAFYTAVLFLLFYCPAKRKAACSPSVTSFSSRFYGKSFLLWCYCFSIYPLIGSAYILSSVTALYRLPSYTSVKPLVAL